MLIKSPHYVSCKSLPTGYTVISRFLLSRNWRSTRGIEMWAHIARLQGRRDGNRRGHAVKWGEIQRGQHMYWNYLKYRSTGTEDFFRQHLPIKSWCTKRTNDSSWHLWVLNMRQVLQWVLCMHFLVRFHNNPIKHVIGLTFYRLPYRCFMVIA